MGNHNSSSDNNSTSNEMDDTVDSSTTSDLFEDFLSDLNELFNIAFETLPNQFIKKMPVIKKRPNLTTFRTTDLYQEIKTLSGNSYTDDKTAPLTERWSLTKLIQERENGIGPKPAGTLTQNESRRISNMYIPNHKEQRMMSLESKVFCGTFNKSGSRLITASQDNIIRVFDSSKGTYHRINRITARDVSWCVLDIDFSPDDRYFVYSTWSDYLHIVPVHGPSEDFQWLHLNADHSISRSCIFSVRFSPCGRYLVGGANDGCIYIYDRVEDRRSKKLRVTSYAHQYTDINAVTFIGDSSDLFISGCDDGVIKLWDLRCIGDRLWPEPAGVYVGHFDGVTYVDSRGDDRYILSNSKDQSIKIWDLRKTSRREEEEIVRNIRTYNWDYRWDTVPREFYNPTRKKDGDCSVMTYRGHRVTKSLIRAKFSPAEQTGQRYIYTGCGTGRVIIFDVLTGVIKEAIEGHKDIVRDVAWHPVRNEIISSSWDSHVNLNTFKRNSILKRRNSTAGRNTHNNSSNNNSNNEEPLRRSRRIALRNS